MSRGVLAEVVICPNAGDEMLAFGKPKLLWLKALKACQITLSSCLSDQGILKDFIRDVSRFQKPELRRTLRLPNSPFRGLRKTPLVGFWASNTTLGSSKN